MERPMNTGTLVRLVVALGHKLARPAAQDTNRDQLSTRSRFVAHGALGGTFAAHRDASGHVVSLSLVPLTAESRYPHSFPTTPEDHQ